MSLKPGDMHALTVGQLMDAWDYAENYFKAMKQTKDPSRTMR